MALRVGVVGLVHDHVWGLLQQWDDVEGTAVVAIAEPDATLHTKVAMPRSRPTFFPSWQVMFGQAELDIVVITTENNAALPVVEAAAALRIAVMLEKPLAASLEDAERIYAVAKSSGVLFMVNWFTMWDPVISTALNIAKSGKIGTLNYFRFRIGHAGPKEIGCTPEFCSWLYDKDRNGGGALVDFCGYGAYMAAWLFGEPLSVSGIAGRWVKRDIEVEDNGVICLQYDTGVAICEGSWTQVSQTQIDGPIIHGDRGSVSVVNGEVQLTLSQTSPYEIIAPEQRPRELRSGPAHFAHCVVHLRQPSELFDPWNALISQRSVVAGLRSADTGIRISLNPVSVR